MGDVRGLDAVRDDVQRSLHLFLGGATFRREMGGTPRRGLLFEGPPGTGKTHLAKAMAAEAGVPFLFVSGTAFQSMYYGATARKIRAYFRALRRAARSEGGAIGFIEEIDAIATTRGGLSATPAPPLPAPSRLQLGCGGLEGLPGWPGKTAAMSSPVVSPSVVSEGVGGVVNELLVQMQSFDTPTGWQRVLGRGADAVNLLLPAHRQLPRPPPTAPTASTRPCCAPGGSTAGSPSPRPTRPDGDSSSITSSPARRTRRAWTTPSAGTPSPASPPGTPR
jgi:SpoVK/Ycf46/Vps4 family AAA+-type ATPase